MGLHFSITDMVKAADNFVDANLKAGAKAVQKGSHVVGGALNGVGLHGAAQSVNSWGDDVADDAGLKVGERGLDETDDPKELVHGDAKKINETAAHLKKFHAAFEKTGTGLARLDHEHWAGAAAEAFQKAFNPQPKQWLAAADACGKAAAALQAYAHTVTWAQGEAAEASRLWKAAKKKYDSAVKATLQAALTYDLQVKAYNATPADQRPTSPPAKPGEFTNPAEADFHRAEEKLDAARTQRDSAARTAAAAISIATRSAPPRPSDMEILKANVKDGLTAAPVSVFHFGGGVVKSGIDLIKLGRSLNFLDPYNLSHPAQYLQGLSTTTAGLIQAGDHPADLVTGLVGSGWGSDPSEAAGRLGGNLLLGGGTGGGGTAATLAEREAAAAARSAAEKAARDAAQKAAKEAAEKAAKEAASAPKAPPPTGLAGLPEGWTVKTTPHPAADAPSGSVKLPPSQKVPHPDLPQPHIPSGPAPHSEVVPTSPGPAGAHSPGRTNEMPGGADPAPTGPPDTAPAKDTVPPSRPPSPAEEMRAAEAEISQGVRTFTDNAEAMRYGSETWDKYVSTLNPDELKSVVDYTGSTYGSINGFLRGEIPESPSLLKYVDDIDKALAGHPVPEDILLTRRTDLFHIPMDAPNMVGKVFTEDSYTSTSIGGPSSNFLHKEAVLHLKVPQGTPALWLEDISLCKGMDEREVLLGRGTQWRADHVIYGDDGKWHIYGEVLPK